MSERPTPETDAVQHEGLLRGNPMPTQVVTVNHARKLERERDELRALLEQSKVHICDFHRDIMGNCIACQVEETK